MIAVLSSVAAVIVGKLADAFATVLRRERTPEKTGVANSVTGTVGGHLMQAGDVRVVGGLRLGGNTQDAGQPVTCAICGMSNPPPDETCRGGNYHFLGTNHPAACPACGRLAASCRRFPCTTRFGAKETVEGRDEPPDDQSWLWVPPNQRLVRSFWTKRERARPTVTARVRRGFLSS